MSREESLHTYMDKSPSSVEVRIGHFPRIVLLLHKMSFKTVTSNSVSKHAFIHTEVLIGGNG